MGCRHYNTGGGRRNDYYALVCKRAPPRSLKDHTCVGDAYTMHMNCLCKADGPIPYSGQGVAGRSWRTKRAGCKARCTQDPRCVAYHFDMTILNGGWCRVYYDKDTRYFGTTGCGNGWNKQNDECGIRKGCTSMGSMDATAVSMHLTGFAGGRRSRRQEGNVSSFNIDSAGDPGVFISNSAIAIANVTGIAPARIAHGSIRPGSIIFEADILPGVEGEPTPTEAAARLSIFLASGAPMVIGGAAMRYNETRSEVRFVAGKRVNPSFYTADEVLTEANNTVYLDYTKVAVQPEECVPAGSCTTSTTTTETTTTTTTTTSTTTTTVTTTTTTTTTITTTTTTDPTKGIFGCYTDKNTGELLLRVDGLSDCLRMSDALNKLLATCSTAEEAINRPTIPSTCVSRDITHAVEARPKCKVFARVINRAIDNFNPGESFAGKRVIKCNAGSLLKYTTALPCEEAAQKVNDAVEWILTGDIGSDCQQTTTPTTTMTTSRTTSRTTTETTSQTTTETSTTETTTPTTTTSPTSTRTTTATTSLTTTPSTTLTTTRTTTATTTRTTSPTTSPTTTQTSTAKRGQLACTGGKEVQYMSVGEGGGCEAQVEHLNALLSVCAGSSHEYVGCYKNEFGSQRRDSHMIGVRGDTVPWCGDTAKAAGRTFFGMANPQGAATPGRASCLSMASVPTQEKVPDAECEADGEIAFEFEAASAGTDANGNRLGSVNRVALYKVAEAPVDYAPFVCKLSETIGNQLVDVIAASEDATDEQLALTGSIVKQMVQEYTTQAVATEFTFSFYVHFLVCQDIETPGSEQFRQKAQKAKQREIVPDVSHVLNQALDSYFDGTFAACQMTTPTTSVTSTLTTSPITTITSTPTSSRTSTPTTSRTTTQTTTPTSSLTTSRTTTATTTPTTTQTTSPTSTPNTTPTSTPRHGRLTCYQDPGTKEQLVRCDETETCHYQMDALNSLARLCSGPYIKGIRYPVNTEQINVVNIGYTPEDGNGRVADIADVFGRKVDTKNVLLFEATYCRGFARTLSDAIAEFKLAPAFVLNPSMGKIVKAKAIQCSAGGGFLKIGNGMSCEDGLNGINALIDKFLDGSIASLQCEVGKTHIIYRTV